LTRGTTRRNADQLAQLIDDLGGSLDGFSGYNSWGLTSQWLSRDWRSGLSLVQESLLTPTFAADQLTVAKTRQIAQIRQQSDDPMSVASLALRREVYGEHPLGRSSVGNEASVQNISRADIANFYNAALQPSGLVISIFGDVNTSEVRRAVEYSFGKFAAKTSALKAPAAPPVLAQKQEKTIEKDGIAQVVQWYGFPSIDVKGEDRYAIDVLDAAMSGSNLPGGRLHARLRDNQLVYVVHAFDQIGLDKGMFVIYAATTTPNSEKVKGIIREELDKVAESGISPQELERAKTMMISSEAIESQGNLSQAQRAASDELFGLGFRNNEEFESRINAITQADVQRVARQYLGSDKAYASVTVQPK
jgi:zinc protease